MPRSSDETMASTLSVEMAESQVVELSNEEDDDDNDDEEEQEEEGLSRRLQ